MLQKQITYFGRSATIACDGKCDKAWGINNRPKVQLDENNLDDYAFLSDNELGIAPVNPGTYEGGEAKPTTDEQKLNKWCARECERCVFLKPDQVALLKDNSITLKDFNKRIYNMPKIHTIQT